MAKVLLVVEGSSLEPKFFEQIKQEYNINLDIYCLKTNIYRLYQKMKEMDFSADLKDVLLEIHDTEEEKNLLKQKFTYTYLVFDLDPHHTERREKDIPIEDIVSNNVTKIEEMAKYFVDETDPSVGKLYINYPMMESFKDCDSLEDEEFLYREIDVENIRNYKSIVGQRKLANKRIDTYTKSEFQLLTKLNLRKLNFLTNKKTVPMDYELFLDKSNQELILNHEKLVLKERKCISVLNTAIFFVLDYYGNRNGFFDDVVQS